MITTKGATMSPRMERLWTFIREREICLTDWSTDEHVEREQASLREGERALVTRAAAAPEDRDLQNLLVDYRAIMNRRPHGRVDATSLREGERRALAARVEIHNRGDEIAEKIGGL